MKIPVAIAALALVGFAGCAAPDTANTRKNRDNTALAADRAKSLEKKDGNLGGDYVADLLLNGSRRDSHKPVFDQPVGDTRTK